MPLPMAFLFCKASLPTEVVDDFLLQAAKTELNEPVGWLLLETEDQPHSESPTQPPTTTTSERQNEFLDKDIEALGTQVLKRIEDGKAQDPARGMGNWSQWTFAVLDERSAKDGTVVIASRYTPDKTEERRAGLIGEDTLPEPVWGELRVKFARASDTRAAVEERPNNFFDMPMKQYLEFKDGVCYW